ncbi:gamma carbonic anhydrase family protein [Haloferax sp. KTX1]|uniref:gamma carbonic anhydrase family protein n=1 Tax=Haloferax sp. KTX1 TaxID=2600597 RepID=UPI0011DDE196|nr:gamma carbonic anhydrase family protein [Haloferax sp. KTX1]
MQHTFDGMAPVIDERASVSEMAYLVGDVAVGPRASLWPFVCLRGDRGAVTVGADTNVQEFTMLHGATVGDGVSIGHGAVIDFATVEDDALVGMGSRVLGGATVESHSIVAANAVVTHDQIVPSGHLAYGVPAETRPLSDAQLAEIDDMRDHYVELGREFVEAGPHRYVE